MSLPHALLGLLAVRPASGYELTKEFEGDFGRYAWNAGHTSIYPELNRLAERGLVTVGGSGPRGRRIYEVTDAGRDELRSWLLAPPTGAGVVRNEHVLRMFLVSAVDPADARQILHRVAERTSQHAAELRDILARGEEAEEQRSGERPRMGRFAAEFGVRLYGAVHDWALWALDELAAEGRADGTAPEPVPGSTAGAGRNGGRA